MGWFCNEIVSSYGVSDVIFTETKVKGHFFLYGMLLEREIGVWVMSKSLLF